MTNEHLAPLWWPHSSLREEWERNLAGPTWLISTQPWVSALLYALVRALGAKNVVELGCYTGTTSAWLALAVEANGGGNVTLVDNVEANVGATRDRLAALPLPHTTVVAKAQTTMEFLSALPTEAQFIFLDDDKEGVDRKVDAMRERAPSALVAIHDIETAGTPTGAFVLATPVLYGSGHLAMVRL